MPSLSSASCTSRKMVGNASLVSDRKSTRLNSSHSSISYAVFCLKKKKRHDPSSFPSFLNAPATPVIYPLSLHDALPIFGVCRSHEHVDVFGGPWPAPDARGDAPDERVVDALTLERLVHLA